MSYRWRNTDADGQDVDGPEQTFAEQPDAEDWLRDSWQDLVDAGVDQVTLLDGEDEVYSMSLRPAD